MIQEGLKTYLLSELCTKITDGSHFSPKVSSLGTKLIATVRDMSEYGFDLDQCKRITDEDYQELIRNGCNPKKGDVLFSKDGTIGLVQYVKEDMELVLLSSIAIFRPNENKINGKFLSYCLKNPTTKKNIKDNYKSGSALPRIVLKDFKKLELEIPQDLAKQSRIASILSSLDDRIELNLQINKTLEAIAQAIFKEWFVDFRYPGFDGEPVAGLPKGWMKVTLAEAVIVKGGSTPSTSNPEYWDGEHYWATPRDLSGLKSPVLLNTERRISDSGVKQISSGVLPKGTLLLSSRAPIGYLAINQIPVSINQGFIAVQGKLVSNLFMLLWLKRNMDLIKGRANGSTFQEISKSSFREIGISIPNSELLNNFDQIIYPVFERIVSNEKENQTLTKVRDALLPKLMTSKIRV